MRYGDLSVVTPPPGIPGVVDGTLTMSVDPDRGVSFHIAVGSDPRRRVQVEFLLSPEHAAVIRAALERDAGSAGPSVPCCIGILVAR